MYQKNMYIFYYSIISLWLIYLAVQDVKTHQIAKRDRLLFLPFALLAIVPNTLQHNSVTLALTDSLLGSVGAFLMLLFVGILASKGKKQMALGGGDIKIMLYLGFIYGVIGIFIIIFLFAILMLIGGTFLLIRKKATHGPAMPYITAACIVYSTIQLILI